MKLLLLFLLPLLGIGAPPSPSYRDITATAQRALATGYYHVPPGDWSVKQLNVPVGATLDCAGATLHIPFGAAYGIQMAGGADAVRNIHLVGPWEGADAYNAAPMHRADFPVLPDGIVVAGQGILIEDSLIERCSRGVFQGLTDSGAATRHNTIVGVDVVDCVDRGISWLTYSDSYFDRIMVSNLMTEGWQYNCPVGFELGSGAGGAIVRDLHVWGNHWIAFEDDAPDSEVLNPRLEGERYAGLLLGAWRITVTGGCIWPAYHGSNIPVGISIGDKPRNLTAAMCTVSGVTLGVADDVFATPVAQVSGWFNSVSTLGQVVTIGPSTPVPVPGK